jgi:hypothetical protein
MHDYDEIYVRITENHKRVQHDVPVHVGRHSSVIQHRRYGGLNVGAVVCFLKMKISDLFSLALGAHGKLKAHLRTCALLGPPSLVL